MFVDKDSGDQGLAVVRIEGQVIGLALSLQRDGDTEVFLGASELDELIRALNRARSMIGEVSSD